RTVDSASLPLLAALLDQGLSRLQFVHAVEQSPEYLQRLVNESFQLGNKAAPSAADLNVFVSFLQNGGSDLVLLAIPGATPQAFVNRFFQDDLHRTPSAAELAVHTFFVQAAGSLRTDQ